jgi:hypothetical protein
MAPKLIGISDARAIARTLIRPTMWSILVEHGD